MPSRNLYIFIGESFRESPGVSREILGTTLTTSLKLSRHKLRGSLVDVLLLALAQCVLIMWAIDAWLMLILAFAVTIKQLKAIQRLNVDLAAFGSYYHLATERVLNYGRKTDLFPGEATFWTLHNAHKQQGERPRPKPMHDGSC